ncbi:hypothetical protein FQA39_LY07440 [Lamprigera yunnana]|nr:hypothetical protein FQA39_LY07440 [Lamprigera yunnana]
MQRIVIFLLVVVTVNICVAQLNFSTGWGKRSQSGNPSGITEGNCKTPVDTLMLIYKLIQNEAQKMQECEKFSK